MLYYLIIILTLLISFNIITVIFMIVTVCVRGSIHGMLIGIFVIIVMRLYSCRTVRSLTIATMTPFLSMLTLQTMSRSLILSIS